MEHGRTGSRYRFFFPVPGSGRLGVAFVNVFVWMLALGFIVSVGQFVRSGVREATDGHSPLYRLNRATDAFDARLRRERGSAVVTGAYDPPLCVVEHQHYVSGKNGGWRTDGTWRVGESARITATLGPDAPSTTASSRPVDPSTLQFDPRRVVVADNDREAEFRVRCAGLPEGGRVVSQCARAGATVFFEGCVDAMGALGGCANGEGLAITTGDGTPQRRVDAHANSVAASISGGMLLAVLLMLYGLYVLRARPLAAALLRWNPPRQEVSYVAPILALVAVTGAAWAISVTRSLDAARDSARDVPTFGYAMGVTVIAFALGMAIWAWDRRRKLVLAMEPVERSETSRLARTAPGVAELAVRVRKDAPTVQVPDHPPHAFVQVEVREAVRRGRSVNMVPLRTASWPAQLAVEDPSGQGMLELTHAEFDLRATFRTVSGDAAQELLRKLADTPFSLVTSRTYESTPTLEVEVSYLDPGESVYLLGNARRMEDPEAQSTYRAMGTVPVIGGAPDARLIVFAGSERSLLTVLGRERAYCEVLGVGFALMSLSHAVVLAYLAAR